MYQQVICPNGQWLAHHDAVLSENYRWTRGYKEVIRPGIEGQAYMRPAEIRVGAHRVALSLLVFFLFYI